MKFLESMPVARNVSPRAPDFTCLQSSVACYDHLNQSIEIRISKDSFLRLLGEWKTRGDVTSIVSAFLRPVVHEFRHWVDMHCTPAGLSTLDYIFRLAADIDDLKATWELKKNISSNQFIIKSDLVPELPWGLLATKSIPYFLENIEHLSLCFFKNVKNRHFCKSPLYLGSMLEANAMWQELSEGIDLVRGEDAWIVEKRALSVEFSRFVYDSNLPEYHSLAHFVAMQKNEMDVLTAYGMASAISTFVLMMPDEFLRNSTEKCVFELRKNERFKEVVNLSREWPREVLYYFIVMNLHKFESLNDVDEIFTLLPYWKGVRHSYYDLVYDGYQKRLRNMAANFGGYFESISSVLESNAQSLWEQKSLHPKVLGLKRPPIFLSDAILPGDDEFSGYEDYFTAVPDTNMAKAIKIGGRSVA